MSVKKSVSIHDGYLTDYKVSPKVFEKDTSEKLWINLRDS